MEDDYVVSTNGASVKVMNSYDYCHFEVCLSLSGICTSSEVDGARKDAQRLVDKAIAQYKTAKASVSARVGGMDCFYARSLVSKVKEIRNTVPESEFTPEHKAAIKALNDYNFWIQRQYDYEDEWEDDRPNLGDDGEVEF